MKRELEQVNNSIINNADQSRGQQELCIRPSPPYHHQFFLASPSSSKGKPSSNRSVRNASADTGLPLAPHLASHPLSLSLSSCSCSCSMCLGAIVTHDRRVFRHTPSSVARSQLSTRV
jgi:hypothetical protein